MTPKALRTLIWITLLAMTLWNFIIISIVAEDMPVNTLPIPFLPILSFAGLLLESSDDDTEENP